MHQQEIESNIQLEMEKLQQRLQLDSSDLEVMVDQMLELRRQIASQRELIATLERDSVTDALTGLFNRRGFERELRKIMASVRRYNRTCALLMVDLNKFKQINDQLGHKVGDMVLRHVANMLIENTRETDIVARLGGDEFCVILVDLGAPDDAEKRARALEKIIYYSPCSTPEGAVQVGVSIGVSPIESESKAIEVLAHADQAMYKRKAQTR